MIYITDETIEKLIKEDVPYLDLTTWIMGIGEQHGVIRFFARANTVLCGPEEVVRICEKLGIEVTNYLASGATVTPDQVFLEATGKGEDLHKAWKVSLNILEHYSGIATRTRCLVEKATAVNPKVTIITTRKHIPGTKELSIKAVLAGGGFPHRLGLSETILIFKQHINLMEGGFNALLQALPQLKLKACEKKVIAEVGSIEEAIELSKAGVDGVQFDKTSAAELRGYVKTLKTINPQMVILAAGGINDHNVEEYAATGVDAVVTTTVYFGKPADFGVKIIKF